MSKWEKWWDKYGVVIFVVAVSTAINIFFLFNLFLDDNRIQSCQEQLAQLPQSVQSIMTSEYGSCKDNSEEVLREVNSIKKRHVDDAVDSRKVD